MTSNHTPRALHRCGCPTCRENPGSSTAEEHHLVNCLVAAADERSRRLLVGFRARQHGRGGVALVARITGLSPHTIRCGGRELSQPDAVPVGGVRRRGAGRKRVAVKHPGS
jgi:hypothetical protein